MMNEVMSRTRLINVEHARVGQCLALDVKVGTTTILTAFSELTEEHISHLRERGVGEIVIVDESTEAAADGPTAERSVFVEPVDDYEVTEPIPDVADAELGGAIAALGVARAGDILPDVRARLRPAKTLHIHAYAYARSLEPDQLLPVETYTEEEEWFSRHKEELRSNAGLVPAMPRAHTREAQEHLKQAFAQLSDENTVSNETLDGLSQLVQDNLSLDRDSHIQLTDISKPEDYIPAHILQTIIAFFKARPDTDEPKQRRLEFIKGIASYNLGLANLSARITSGEGPSEAALGKLHDGYKSLYHRLRRAERVEESVLELVFLQNEHADGNGFPYGLSDDSIPQDSQLLALSSRFSLLTLSKPRIPRLTPRNAVVRILASVSKNFCASAAASFMRGTGVYPVGSAVKLSDHRLALVTRQNADALLAPVVRAIRSDDDGSVAVRQPMDLRQKELSIVGVLREF